MLTYADECGRMLTYAVTYADVWACWSWGVAQVGGSGLVYLLLGLVGGLVYLLVGLVGVMEVRVSELTTTTN